MEAGPFDLCFDECPFLLVRLAPAIYHIELLPESQSLRSHLEAAFRQCASNQMDVCLALDEDEAVWFSPLQGMPVLVQLPREATLIAGRLQPAFPRTGEADAPRRERLLRAIEAQYQPGQSRISPGDLTKGGRFPLAEEMDSLCGSSPEGIPNGLQRCSTCGDWNGDFLEVDGTGQALVQRVVCFCANNSICALCGTPLYARKVYANYWSEWEQAVIHVPGFTALTHQCTAGNGIACEKAESGKLRLDIV